MTMIADNRQLAVSMNLMEGVGTRVFRRSLERYGDLASLAGAGTAALADCGFGETQRHAWKKRDHAAVARSEEEAAARHGARLLSWFDDGYPDALRALADPPPVLAVRGSLPAPSMPAVALVGSRNPSPYGRSVAGHLGRELGRAGVAVISGMARGIDTAAHRGALDAGGTTVAVLGSGIDIVYPPENRDLARSIAGAGALVTEFPVGTPPGKYTFPRRNRLIAGLARATVVVEAAEKSGALITAEFAMEGGREVMAVPGPLTSPLSAGCHALIRDGATLVSRAADVLEAVIPGFQPATPATQAGPAGSPAELAVLAALGGESLVLDEVAERCRLPVQEAGAVLLGLELRGIVSRAPGHRYHRTPEIA